MDIKEIELLTKKVTDESYQHPWNKDIESIIKNNEEFYHYFAKGNLDGSGGMYPFMYELVKKQKPNHVVELGNREGMGILSIYAALQENSCGSLTTIDVIKDLKFVPDNVKNDKQIDYLFGDVNSSDILNTISKKPSIDLILFDTIHTYAQLESEWNNYVNFFSDQAIVLIDDLNYEKNFSNSKQKFFEELTGYEKTSNNKLHGSGFGIVLFDKKIYEQNKNLEDLNADDFWENQ